MIEFIWSLLTGFFQVFLGGGFIILGLKYYEWYDDRLIVKKFTQGAAKEKFNTVELIPPVDTSLSISEMQAFFTETHVVSGNRSPDEIYSSGAGFYNLAFEIIGHDSKVEYFLTMESSRLDLTLSFLHNYYPSVQVKHREHPFKTDWPKQWWDQDGFNGSKAYRGADIVPASSDLHPLKSWKKFYNSGNGNMTTDPMSILMGTLRNMPKDAYLVMQYIFRPHVDAQKSRMKGWEEVFQKLRKEFIENNIVEKVGTTVQSLTTEEEEILQNAQVKMKSSQYKTKLRYLLIYDKKSNNVDEGNIKKGIAAYFQELSTSVQNLKDSDDTNTAKKYSGGKFGFLDGIIGDWLNRVYWTTSEKSYRMRRLYAAILDQSLDMGEDSSKFFLDPESMASLFHFPQVKMVAAAGLNSPIYTTGQPMMQGQSPDGRSVVIQQYQPAFYMLQPDGTQVPVNPVRPMQVYNPATGQAMVSSIAQSVLPQQVFGQTPDLKSQPPEDLPT